MSMARPTLRLQDPLDRTRQVRHRLRRRILDARDHGISSVDIDDRKIAPDIGP
jgi:hypothetical protein